MKTFFLAILLVLAVCFTSYSQTQRGTLMIGGNGFASFSKGFIMDVSPNFVYFVADNVAVGATSSLFYHK